MKLVCVPVRSSVTDRMKTIEVLRAVRALLILNCTSSTAIPWGEIARCAALPPDCLNEMTRNVFALVLR
jgi:hypothetical protein